MSSKLMGNVICKGMGLKVYFRIPLTRRVNGILESKTFTYEVGSIQQVLTEANRQVSANYIAGRKNPVGTNKGIRSTYGTITFTQLDCGFINTILKDVKKWDEEREHLEAASLEGFSFENFSFNEFNKELMSGPKEKMTVNVYESDVIMLDDLPPVDIIIVGSADNIDPDSGKFEINKQYVFKCLKTVFLSETFGISAGGPLHNVATKCIFLGGVEPWQEMEEANVN